MPVDRYGEIERTSRHHAERIAALEDRTAGQRLRIAALEEGANKLHGSVGRIEDRQHDRQVRVEALERYVRKEVAAPPGTSPLSALLTDLRVLLLGAIMVGYALGKAGIDPGAWFR